MKILAADIGGTKTNVGLFETTGPGAELRAGAERTYRTHDQKSVGGTLLEFLKYAGTKPSDVRGCCVGLAGPVEDGICVAEWLPWREVDEKEVSAEAGIANIRLINDMVAAAWGVTALRDDQVVEIQAGEKKAGRNVAVIAAGTGLGESALIYDDGKYHALTSEGGHTDWAPRNQTELGLFKFLLDRSHRVTNEHVIRGQGLVNVYTYFKSLETGVAPKELPDSDEQAIQIAKEAAANPNSAAGKAIELFVAAYGGRAGNLAMQVMATGGVYVGGGIAPKNLDRFRDGTFIRNFLDKGPLFGPILEKIPVYVVLEQKTALIGAAKFAAEHLSARG